jgi:hypothetical protein
MSSIVASRKFAWGAGIVLVALYLGPSILRFFLTAAHSAQANVVQPKLTKPAPGIPAPNAAIPAAPVTTASVPVPPPPAATDPSLAMFLGNWEGYVATNRGNCVLTLEVRDNHDKDHPLAGYSTLGCMPSIFELLDRAKGKKQTPAAAMAPLAKQPHPTEAILAGSLVSGALEFKVQKNIGVSDGECPMSSISVTPFAEQIAVEWKESQEGCTGGQLLMKRE